MIIDHFQKNLRKSPIDWNFNVVFESQSAAVKLASSLSDSLKHEGLYPAIPAQWLHITILRVGFFDDFTTEQMLMASEILAKKLEAKQLPDFSFDNCEQWDGDVVLTIRPREALGIIYRYTIDSILEATGRPYSLWENNIFIPHITVAYTKTRDDKSKNEIDKKWDTRLLKPTKFKIDNVCLVKQWPTEGHYEWDIINRIDLR